MSLAHPSLTLLGKKKGKVKFRNAEQARKARELQSSWEDLQKKWGSKSKPSKNKQPAILPVRLPTQTGTYRRDTGPKFHSLNDGKDMGPAVKAPSKVYTGDKIIGIGTMHKSNVVPIFSEEQAKDISTMRRG